MFYCVGVTKSSLEDFDKLAQRIPCAYIIKQAGALYSCSRTNLIQHQGLSISVISISRSHSDAFPKTYKQYRIRKAECNHLSAAAQSLRCANLISSVLEVAIMAN